MEVTIFKRGSKIISDISKAVLDVSSPLNFSHVSRKSALRKLGKSPGSLIYTGKERLEKVEIQVIDYTGKEVIKKDSVGVEDILKYRKKKSTTWINVTGVHDVELVKRIGEIYGLHPLILEDIVNTDQRPKIEDYDDNLFIVSKMFYFDKKEEKIKGENVSIILGDNFVLTFQENVGDVFDPIRKRIEEKRVRLINTDYLCYALLDLIVDNYFLILEIFGEHISLIEEKLMKESSPDILNLIYSLKRELIFIRKSVLPLREVIAGFQKLGDKFIRPETEAYIKDVYDHQVQVIDTVDTYRDMLSGLQDLFLSISGNKMNEVMKVLTIIATIFIPLTFIAGIYGMNFEYMPELSYRLGYPVVWGVMVLVSFLMIFYFRKKKWM